ncbi:hypothetical protein IE81DRAFT_350065 [Ceraceosorus guamensis]|uniref:Uncharacterized protein n=1 Tax=Ceraceosorus guamensis TaxID=1522189 RepID=A0A316VPV2_9BASI|nr:hypothetical protein IE81DRAFT_350065 [Ceraceosorus guamensis]PWN39552.1 hypothetical protein IE81DRAFT_350065 [Ceraceosorus guamensis]
MALQTKSPACTDHDGRDLLSGRFLPLTDASSSSSIFDMFIIPSDLLSFAALLLACTSTAIPLGTSSPQSDAHRLERRLGGLPDTASSEAKLVEAAIDRQAVTLQSGLTSPSEEDPLVASTAHKPRRAPLERSKRPISHRTKWQSVRRQKDDLTKASGRNSPLSLHEWRELRAATHALADQSDSGAQDAATLPHINKRGFPLIAPTSRTAAALKQRFSKPRNGVWRGISSLKTMSTGTVGAIIRSIKSVQASAGAQVSTRLKVTRQPWRLPRIRMKLRLKLNLKVGSKASMRDMLP